MSADDENPVLRWSRRKQAAREGGAADAAPEPPPSPRPVADTAAAPPEEDSPPLPSIDDLAPGDDLTAFLRKSVPQQLRNAALRKMWSLDPAIRDHIGLAENSWDFNRPETIPGFGPIVTQDAPEFFSLRPPDEPAGMDAPVAAVRAPDAAPAASAAHAKTAPAVGEASLRCTKSEAAADGDAPRDDARRLHVSRHGGALPRE